MSNLQYPYKQTTERPFEDFREENIEGRKGILLYLSYAEVDWKQNSMFRYTQDGTLYEKSLEIFVSHHVHVTQNKQIH